MIDPYAAFEIWMHENGFADVVNCEPQDVMLDRLEEAVEAYGAVFAASVAGRIDKARLNETISTTRSKPLKRGGRIKPRKFNKKPTVDGDSLKDVRDECDALVRTIIALRDVKCVNFDCRETKGLHVGHYIKRGVLALRWDLRNCNAQCDPHNEAHNLNPKPYQEAMILKYGIGITWQIEDNGKESPRLEYSDMLSTRDGLRREAAEMVKP